MYNIIKNYLIDIKISFCCKPWAIIPMVFLCIGSGSIYESRVNQYMYGGKIILVKNLNNEYWFLAEADSRLLVEYNKIIYSQFKSIEIGQNLRINEEFWNIFLNLCTYFYNNLLVKDTTAHFEGYKRGCDGPVYFISSKAKAEEIKKICVQAEENIPGARMLDIDVMDSKKVQISRSDIGLSPRKCFICDNPAYLCVSGRIHSKDQILFHVEKLKMEALKIRNSL
jgi:holo-ACP synthase CitX